mmetsp:Transcript_22097/g.43491  ORF Transcript_22097/g.43491 Transcript_22097/m.43491 type:complete len:681 (+) Transcript_22097:75-2117(+)
MIGRKKRPTVSLTDSDSEVSKRRNTRTHVEETDAAGVLPQLATDNNNSSNENNNISHSFIDSRDFAQESDLENEDIGQENADHGIHRLGDQGDNEDSTHHPHNHQQLQQQIHDLNEIEEEDDNTVQHELQPNYSLSNHEANNDDDANLDSEVHVVDMNTEHENHVQQNVHDVTSINDGHGHNDIDIHPGEDEQHHVEHHSIQEETHFHQADESQVRDSHHIHVEGGHDHSGAEVDAQNQHSSDLTGSGHEEVGLSALQDNMPSFDESGMINEAATGVSEGDLDHNGLSGEGDENQPPLEPDREVAALLAMRALSAHFKATAGLWLRSRLQNHFESWLWRRREDVGAQSVLFHVSKEMLPEEELCRKLSAVGADDAVGISASLDAKISEIHDQIAIADRHNEDSMLPRGCVSREDLSALMCSFRYIGHDGTPLVAIPLLKSYYEGRLRDLWRSANPDVDENEKPHAYDEAVFCLLCRYLALQGGELKGSGVNQCGVLDTVLDVLQTEFDIEGECFGSPLNSRLPWFCTMFPDVDRQFGSQGDFFDQDFIRGSFEAHPPYTPSVVIRMYEHLRGALERAEAADEILQFFVIIPHWPSRAQVLASDAYARLDESSFKTSDLVLRRSRHAFREGGQHYKGDSEVRVSSDASTVFILQTRAASKVYSVTAARRAALEKSFEPPSH